MPILPAGSYFGARRRDRRVGSTALTETVYHDGERLDRHGHATTTVFLPISGAIHESAEGRTACYSPGNVVVTPPDRVHQTRPCGPETRVLNLQFSEKWLDRIGSDIRLEGRTSVSLPSISRRLIAEFFSDDPFSDLAIEGLIAELFVSFGRSRSKMPRSRPRWLNQAEQIIKARSSDRLTLDELASSLNVDRAHLARSFRAHLGQSVGEYVRAERIRQAIDLLPDRRRTLADIAARCGFADQSHFTRVFRDLQGTTPAQYRRSL